MKIKYSCFVYEYLIVLTEDLLELHFLYKKNDLFIGLYLLLNAHLLNPFNENKREKL